MYKTKKICAIDVLEWYPFEENQENYQEFSHEHTDKGSCVTVYLDSKGFIDRTVSFEVFMDDCDPIYIFVRSVDGEMKVSIDDAGLGYETTPISHKELVRIVGYHYR